jgi:hypothetical protein
MQLNPPRGSTVLNAWIVPYVGEYSSNVSSIGIFSFSKYKSSKCFPIQEISFSKDGSQQCSIQKKSLMLQIEESIMFKKLELWSNHNFWSKSISQCTSFETFWMCMVSILMHQMHISTINVSSARAENMETWMMLRPQKAEKSNRGSWTGAKSVKG